MFNDKGMKKLDLNSLSKKEEIDGGYLKTKCLMEKANSNIDMNEKEKFVENLVTKDYEKYMEFISYEDYFSEKIVNLQNPFYFVPYRLKNNQLKSNKEKDFFGKMANKLIQSDLRSQTNTPSKIDKIKKKN